MLPGGGSPRVPMFVDNEGAGKPVQNPVTQLEN